MKKLSTLVVVLSGLALFGMSACGTAEESDAQVKSSEQALTFYNAKCPPTFNGYPCGSYTVDPGAGYSYDLGSYGPTHNDVCSCGPYGWLSLTYLYNHNVSPEAMCDKPAGAGSIIQWWYGVGGHDYCSRN